MSIIIHHKSKVNTSDLLAKYSALIIPKVQKKGSKALPPVLDVAFATLDKKMIGLALATVNEVKKRGKLISLFVAPNYRTKGIAQKLLKEVEVLLSTRRLSEIKTNYRAHWKSTPQVSHILAKAGWSLPDVEFIMVDGLAANVLQLFKANEAPYPEGYKSIPWSELNREDIQQLRKQTKNQDVPSDQNPFIAESSINKDVSLILKFENNVIGWVISHQLSKETNEFTSYYIADKHRSFRLAHKLMRETIFRQHEMTDLKRFIIVAKKSNALMSNFLLRHAEKTGVKLIQTLYSKKQLY